MTREIIDQLKGSFLFRGLPDEALAAVAQKAAIRKIAEGEVLIRKGDVGDSLFMIHDGWMKIVAEDGKGGELIINKAGPGETLGEMALLDRAPRSATVVAISDAEVLELKQDAFEDILNQRPDLSLALIRGFSSRLRFSTTYIQKAINWTQRIAAGDYSIIEDSQSILKQTGTDEDKAGQLLSSFFQMAKSVKAREDELKQKLSRLTVRIDKARLKREIEEITGSDFYSNLKEQARVLRAQRKDK